METKDVPAVEDKDTKEVVADPIVEETKKEATIGEELGTKKVEPKAKEVRTVPEATFLEMKNDFKALKKSIDDSNKSKADVTGDISDIAKRYDIKPKFLTELVDEIKGQTKKEFDAEIAEKLQPLKDKEKSEKIETAFDTAYLKALDKAPEFKDVVNRDVIKALSLNPENASKTFNKIMEESYGHLIQGKRTIDPSGGPAPRETTDSVDFDRIKNDTKYFGEVMANPKLKAEYNDSMTERLSSVI